MRFDEIRLKCNRLPEGRGGLRCPADPTERDAAQVVRARPLRIDLWADLLATIDAALRDAPDVIHLCHAGLGPWIPALRASRPDLQQTLRDARSSGGLRRRRKLNTDGG